MKNNWHSVRSQLFQRSQHTQGTMVETYGKIDCFAEKNLFFLYKSTHWKNKFGLKYLKLIYFHEKKVDLNINLNYRSLCAQQMKR